MKSLDWGKLTVWLSTEVSFFCAQTLRLYIYSSRDRTFVHR